MKMIRLHHTELSFGKGRDMRHDVETERKGKERGNQRGRAGIVYYVRIGLADWSGDTVLAF